MPVTRRCVRLVLGLCTMLWLTACGQPAGTACSIAGSGFTSSHDCATKCLALWAVNCPDNTSVMPAVCAGRRGCSPGSCPDGQVCYTFDDPFDERSYCVPDTVCGAPPPAQARRRWELESASRAAASREAMAAKRARRTGVPKTPTDSTAPATSKPARE